MNISAPMQILLRYYKSNFKLKHTILKICFSVEKSEVATDFKNVWNNKPYCEGKSWEQKIMKMMNYRRIESQ